MKTKTSQKPVGTREWYEFIAPIADAGLTIHVGGEAATATLIEMLGLTDADHVLDVGTGPGVTATRIARDIGTRITGIDLSPTMIAKAV